MGWNFRKALRFGPFRVNLSRSGVGYSLGIPGLRIGKDAKGRKYTSLGIPGTGIYRRDYSSGATSQPKNTGLQSNAGWFQSPRIYYLALMFLFLLWTVIKLMS
jgi:hypothetical protein